MFPGPYVVLEPGATVTREALVAHCREHLAADTIPRAVQFVDAVPVTVRGTSWGVCSRTTTTDHGEHQHDDERARIPPAGFGPFVVV